MNSSRLVLTALVATITVYAVTAHAKPFTYGKTDLAGNVAYGLYFGRRRADPYGFGLGGRGGFTFEGGLHLGASAEYFFGTSYTGLEGNATYHLAMHNLKLMFEPTYDIGIGRVLVLRPQIGVGMSYAYGKACQDCGDASFVAFAYALGALFLYDLGGVMVAAGVRGHNRFREVFFDTLSFSLGVGTTF